MSFFSKALDDLQGLESDILGPDYPYYKYINSPSDMGMSADGDKISQNIAGLFAYTKVLSTGQGKASATGGPLGNKFFLKTGAKCKDKKSGEKVERALYINNVPDGSIPFISSMTGQNFSTLEGLIPGVLSDVAQLNPLAIFQAFMLGNTPECQAVTMETIDSKNVKKTEQAFVATADLQNMNPCWFPDRKNPITGKGCQETFTGSRASKEFIYPDDPLVKLYYTALGIFGIYLLMKSFTRR